MKEATNILHEGRRAGAKHFYIVVYCVQATKMTRSSEKCTGLNAGWEKLTQGA